MIAHIISITRSCLIAILFAAGPNLVAGSTTHAQVVQRPRRLVAHFKKLGIRNDDAGRLVLKYKISAKAAPVDSILRVDALNGEAELVRRIEEPLRNKGQIAVAIRTAQTVRISVIRHRRLAADFSVGKFKERLRSLELVLPIAHPTTPVPATDPQLPAKPDKPPTGSNTSVIHACHKIMYSEADAKRCVEAAAGKPAEIVTICGDIMYSSRDKLGCIRQAHAKADSAGLRACGSEFYSSKDRIRCIGLLGKRPAAYVHACKSGAHSSKDRLSCVDISRDVSVGDVRACDENTSSSSKFLSCVRLVANAARSKGKKRPRSRSTKAKRRR